MFRPGMAIIMCLEFSSYKETAVFAFIIVDINLWSAHRPSYVCFCVDGCLFLSRCCVRLFRSFNPAVSLETGPIIIE
jgi:hypothetical protein